VEPYVVAADVYAVAPHTGRGGWTWYTGSAGWMYRLIVESLLGLKLEGDRLHVAPCLPAEWNEFKLSYRYRETEYHITVLRSNAEEEEQAGVTVDGTTQADDYIQLIDDQKTHEVGVRVKAKTATSESLLAK
jgi:cyclic beta-1,2-glucan synthetase